MLRLVGWFCCVLALLSPAIVWAQASSGAVAQVMSSESPRQHLAQVQTIRVASEDATLFVEPLKCDRSGNLYLHSDQFGISGIRKLSPKGERLALFRPSSDPELKVSRGTHFSVAPNGEVYQIVFPRDQIARYVLAYNPDGTFKTRVKLQPGFPWIPVALAVLPSGDLLVTGEEFDRDPDE